MKRGKVVKSKGKKKIDVVNASVFVLFLMLGLFLVFSVSSTPLWNKMTGQPISENAGVSATVSNAAPLIVSNNLDGTLNIAPLAGATRLVAISFKVQDNNGYNDISMSSANTFARISKGGVVRQSSPGSCTKLPGGTPKRADITCNVPMQYYDENANDWNVVVSAGDLGGLSGIDSARSITVDLLKDITITTTPVSSPTMINFTMIIPGGVDQAASNDPIDVTNNGNYVGAIVVDGFNLTNGADVIPIGSFAASGNSGQECITVSESGIATQLTDTVGGDVITSSNLPRGPFGSNVGQLFFCADNIPDPLSSGVYESRDSGGQVPWVIMLQ